MALTPSPVKQPEFAGGSHSGGQFRFISRRSKHKPHARLVIERGRSTGKTIHA